LSKEELPSKKLRKRRHKSRENSSWSWRRSENAREPSWRSDRKQKKKFLKNNKPTTVCRRKLMSSERSSRSCGRSTSRRRVS